MYSIGQFAVMMNINKKTLRYYDDIGLFKPAYVDENNQYRYYDEPQISVIKRIVDLKNIGISLEQIKSILNQENSSDLNKTYLDRLNEIETLIEELNDQKNLIEQRVKGRADEQVLFNSHTVEKGFFIEEGFVYYTDVNCDFDQVNLVISDFYSNSKGIPLKTGHIFKKNLDEFSKDIGEIFAYTSNNEIAKQIRHQNRLLCLKVVCESIGKRENALKTLFDYARENNLAIDAIFEKYLMVNGSMTVEIIGSIL